MDFSEDTGIDLHIHSTASDGTLSPLEILSTAVKQRLKAISITDHDTTAGCREALLHGIPPSLAFLTGVEISASPPSGFNLTGSIHILGYGIDIENRELNQSLDLLKSARENRNPKIIQRLNRLGIDISYEDVMNEVGGGIAGRPHIASALIKKGVCGSINEAFDTYLGKGKPAYVDKYRIESIKAIEIIKGAGGIPVLAHPYLVGIAPSYQFEAFLKVLVSMGLMGLEVYYPEHTPDAVNEYESIARRYGLLITGGTDFHGDINAEIKMGSGNGDLFTPYALFETLQSRILHESGMINKTREKKSGIEKTIHYQFNNTDYLDEALRHSSFVNEQPPGALRDNERLEFLGDAVLSLVVGDILMHRHPDINEGDLSRIRANLVNEARLADVARQIDLGAHLKLGKGEIQTKGRDKNSILADAFEALIASIYLDGGFDSAFSFIESHFLPFIESVTQASDTVDHKSRIQEMAQLSFRQVPKYSLTGESGPDHDKTFTIVMKVGDLETCGTGKSKKAAQQDAAKKGVEILLEKETPPKV